MYTIYISSMAADVSFVPALLMDTLQLQVKFLNVNQLLLRSLPQTVSLCNAHEVMLLSTYGARSSASYSRFSASFCSFFLGFQLL